MIKKRDLQDVTLCAATSINIEQTLMAIEHCVRQINFGKVLLLTDVYLKKTPDWLAIEPIRRLASSDDYSRFILEELVDHISTDHVLLVQWDGFVLDANHWEDDFTDRDYIGASWPQFTDAYKVGNGGFSIRSKKLLEACRDPGFKVLHPEDVCICRDNRAFLEERFGIRFADKDLADRFSFERYRSSRKTFGFHGVFNMIDAVGLRYFLAVYEGLDDRRIVFMDYWSITRAVIRRAREVGRLAAIRLLARLSFGYGGYLLDRIARAVKKRVKPA